MTDVVKFLSQKIVDELRLSGYPLTYHQLLVRVLFPDASAGAQEFLLMELNKQPPLLIVSTRAIISMKKALQELVDQGKIELRSISHIELVG